MERTADRDRLWGALVGLARATDSHEGELTDNTFPLFLEAIRLLDSPVSECSIDEMTFTIHQEKAAVTPGCAACKYPCGRTDDFDMEELYSASVPVRESKIRLMEGILSFSRSVSNPDDREYKLLAKAVFYLGEYLSPEQIDAVTTELRE